MEARAQNLNMIPVYLLAFSLVWSVRPQSVTPVIQRLLGHAAAQSGESAPGDRQGDPQTITRIVRGVGIVMCVISLVLVQMAVHAAMTHRPH